LTPDNSRSNAAALPPSSSFAERTLFHRRFEVSIRRGDDTDIDPDRSLSAQALDRPLFTAISRGWAHTPLPIALYAPAAQRPAAAPG
jgi:hypothetical protein